MAETAAPGARPVVVRDLGRMPYETAWRIQHDLVEAHKAGRGRDHLLLVEHDPVITLGRRARAAHVVAGPEALRSQGVSVVEVERGGDATYHGPGQLVAYPILDLRAHRKDVRWFADGLLAALAETVGAFGLAAEARHGVETGVWLRRPAGRPAKIAALGLRVERWVTYHGVALNVDPDLRHFGWIVPCGLQGIEVTSMAAELGRPVDMVAVRNRFLAAFAERYGVRLEGARP